MIEILVAFSAGSLVMLVISLIIKHMHQKVEISELEYSRLIDERDALASENMDLKTECMKYKNTSTSLRKDNDTLRDSMAEVKRDKKTLSKLLADQRALVVSLRKENHEFQSGWEEASSRANRIDKELAELKEQWEAKHQKWKDEKQIYFQRIATLEQKLLAERKNVDTETVKKLLQEREKFEVQKKQLERERDAALLSAETVKKQHEQSSSTISELKHELSCISVKFEQSVQQVSTAEAKRLELGKELENAREENKALNGKLVQLHANLDAMQKEMVELTRNLTMIQKESTVDAELKERQLIEDYETKLTLLTDSLENAKEDNKRLTQMFVEKFRQLKNEGASSNGHGIEISR